MFTNEVFEQPDQSPEIPIITIPTNTCTTPTTLPKLPSQLPPRCRNEPAVLGCATGEVRRMRSVLDMKLGPMAVPLDTHLASPDIDPFLGISQQPYNQVDNLPSTSCSQQLVDIFGIAIPPSTAIKMHGRFREPVYRKTDSEDSSSTSSSYKSEGACSVILAESPSRLDLSALLC